MVIRRMSVLTVVLAAVLAAAGCARDDESAGAPAAAPPAAAPSPSPATPGTTELPATDLPLPDKSAPGAAGATTISGTVTAGVEPNCLLLTGAGTDHLLIFADPAMRADAAVGAKVTVTGQAQPGQMTTCQQGTPFLVTSVRPN
jgi:hypothetical protein